MKVLWFTNTPSLYETDNHSYHGGGWIGSLEGLLEKQDTTLAIAFFHSKDQQKIVKNKTTYYPIKRSTGKQKPVQTIVNNWLGRLTDDVPKYQFLKIIEDFKPDVIHVFGSESGFAAIQNFTSIPVLIHIQGIINPCLYAYYPIGISKCDFLLNTDYLYDNLIASSPPFNYRRFKKQAQREERLLKQTKNVNGRTHWDKIITNIYNPKVNYFHIEEVLRPIFYDTENKVEKKTNIQINILSTLSSTVYKGIDVILKTAQLLKNIPNIKYTWNIAGLESNDKLLGFFETKINVNHKDLNIKCCGRKNSLELVKLMKNADVFVHPSYIDNSPNSICEAQIMGLPIIACNVGGVSTLVKNEETGFLVPSNGIFEITNILNLLYKDIELRNTIGLQAREEAMVRHNRKTIITDLIGTYSLLVK